MGHRNLRVGRRSEKYRAYLVTTVTDKRYPWFEHLQVARIVINALRHLHDQGHVISLAWCLMPDHLHWLFILQEGTLCSTINQLKGRSSFACNRVLKREGRLWAPAFHDRAVRGQEDVRTLARYVVANPLRAGLVDDIGQYPHWDSIWLDHSLEW